MKLLLILPALALAGCASSLKVYDSNKNELVGVPVATPLLVRVTSVTKYSLAPNSDKKFEGFCVAEENSEYKMLPLGERTYINFDAAQFGKSEFKLEFSDAGSLKVVSLNSDPSKALEVAGSLAEAVLPFVASKKPDPVALGADPAQKVRDTHCIKGGTQVVSIEAVQVRPSQ